MTILREISISVLNFLMCYLLPGSSRSSAQKKQVGAIFYLVTFAASYLYIQVKTHGVPLFSSINLGHDYYLV